MCKRILGRIREAKITNTELSWLYSALPGSQSTPFFGVLPLHVGYLFETGYYKEPEASPSRDLPRIEYMKKSKCISEDERGGFKVAKVNLPLSDGRFRLFLEGKEDWLEEGLLVPAKKNKREGL
jgi:hypothetical protein